MTEFESTNQMMDKLAADRRAVADLEKAIREVETRLGRAQADVSRLEAEAGRRRAAVARSTRVARAFAGSDIANLVSAAPADEAALEALRGPWERALSEAGTLEARLQRLRTTLAVTRARLAEVEASMTAGEIVQSGQPAPEYVDHRERLNAIRTRMGFGDTVA